MAPEKISNCIKVSFVNTVMVPAASLELLPKNVRLAEVRDKSEKHPEVFLELFHR